MECYRARLLVQFFSLSMQHAVRSTACHKDGFKLWHTHTSQVGLSVALHTNATSHIANLSLSSRLELVSHQHSLLVIGNLWFFTQKCGQLGEWWLNSNRNDCNWSSPHKQSYCRDLWFVSSLSNGSTQSRDQLAVSDRFKFSPILTSLSRPFSCQNWFWNSLNNF